MGAMCGTALCRAQHTTALTMWMAGPAMWSPLSGAVSPKAEPSGQAGSATRSGMSSSSLPRVSSTHFQTKTSESRAHTA